MDQFTGWTENEWKKQPIFKGKLWKSLRNLWELLAKTSLKDYVKALLFGSKM